VDNHHVVVIGETVKGGETASHRPRTGVGALDDPQTLRGRRHLGVTGGDHENGRRGHRRRRGHRPVDDPPTSDLEELFGNVRTET
jgi:hypothetical protein